LFRRVELLERVDAMRAVIVTAFVNNDVEADFPAEQCAVAMRAIIFGFRRSFITVVSVKCRRADLTKELGSFFTVVVVQVLVRGFAERALFGLRDGFPVANLNGFEWTATFGQYFVNFPVRNR
jgi:hypothetical protein